MESYDFKSWDDDPIWRTISYFSRGFFNMLVNHHFSVRLRGDEITNRERHSMTRRGVYVWDGMIYPTWFLRLPKTDGKDPLFLMEVLMGKWRF